MIAIAAFTAAGVGPRSYGSAEMESVLTEFQAGHTLNARLAADVDKLDNLLQVAVYRVDPKAVVPDSREFEQDVRGRLTTHTVARIWQEISREISGRSLSQITNSHEPSGNRRRSPLR